MTSQSAHEMCPTVPPEGITEHDNAWYHFEKAAELIAKATAVVHPFEPSQGDLCEARRQAIEASEHLREAIQLLGVPVAEIQQPDGDDGQKYLLLYVEIKANGDIHITPKMQDKE